MASARPACVFVVVALAVGPTPALAQDAGGGQYKDPLANPTSTPHTSTPPPPPTSTSSTGGGPTALASAGSTASNGEAAADSGQPPAPGEIPRTGFPVGLLMFAGALFLSGGLLIRRAAGSTAP
jgi:hypothetical protein